MNFFKIFAIVIVLCSLEARAGKASKHQKAKHTAVHHKKRKAIAHKLSTRAQKGKSQKHRKLFFNPAPILGIAALAEIKEENKAQQKAIQEINERLKKNENDVLDHQAKLRTLTTDPQTAGIDGTVIGLATGVTGVALTQLERAQQKKQILKIKSQINQQAAVIGGQQAKVIDLLKDLDSRIDTMRTKVINMQSDIDTKIIEYRKAIKRRLDEDELYSL